MTVKATRTSALLLCSLAVGLGATHAQQFEAVVVELPPDPAELLRATFDRGYSDYYGRGLEAEFARGSGDVVLLAYDRGNNKDIGLYRATDCDGVKEKALNIGRGQSHRYSAAGNVNLRRGTVAFWVRFSQDVGEVHHSIFSISHVARSGLILGIRGRYHRLRCHGPFSDSHYFEAQPWQADTWYHLAVTWDELEGLRFYKNGELTNEVAPLTWQTDDLEPDKIVLGSWDPWGGTEVPLAVDDLRIFSRALSAEEVKALCDGQQEFPALRAEGSEAVTEHRAQYLGWDQAEEMAQIEPAQGEGTLLVQQVGIEQARAVKSQAWKVCDGDRLTRWPLTYHGYSFQGESGLSLKLVPGQPWNYLRAIGPCKGVLYPGMHISPPSGPTTEAWMRPLLSEGPLFTRRFANPIEQTEMTFFAAQPDEEAGEQPSRIREIGFYRLVPGATGDMPGEPLRYYLSAEPWGDWSSEIGLIMQSKFETYDRTALRCARQPALEARSLRMQALRYCHFMLPSPVGDCALGGLRAVLFFRDLAPGTVIWLRANDPIIPTRHIADFEVRAAGDWSGIQRADLTLDMRDYVIPDGRPLWLWLITSNDAELVWDGERYQSRFELLVQPTDALAGEYRHDQLAFVKDRFIDVSEPRPWGKVAMEDLAERVGVFMELHRALDDLHTRFPDDVGASAYHIWTHPNDPVDRSHLKPPGADGAPEWAVYERAAFGRYLDFVHWWIDNRQVPNGEFGHNYSDDVDLINDWVSVGKISDPDGRIADSVRRLGDFCWDTGPLENGINRVTTDPLHAYEEGLNATCQLALMYYGNPVYMERLMEATRTVEEHLTGITRGRRHFKSRLYGARQIVTEPPYNQDVLSSTLMMHPALYLGYYSRNPRAVELVREYGEAWLQLLEQAIAEVGELPEGVEQVLPAVVRFDDGEVVGKSHVFSGYGCGNMYMALQEWTGDDRYFLPEKTWLDRQFGEYALLLDWLDRVDMTPYREGLLQRAAEVTYDDLRPAMGNDTRTQVQYAGWKLGAPRDAIVQALRASWERIELLFPMHTWAEQSADRVAVSKDLVDRLYLGGTPGYRNYIYPTHSVSWEGFSPDFAAWVLETTPRKLSIIAYNFQEQPQSGRIRVWRLEPGTYMLRLGPDQDEDGTPDAAVMQRPLDLCKGAAVEIELPSKQTVAISIEQVQATGEDFYARCDLALAPQDTVISDDASEVTVRVHNLGNGEAPRFTVQVLGEQGRPAFEQTAGPLAAPVDCTPKVTELKWQVPQARRGQPFTVVVDPEDAIPELYQGNNSVALPAG
jgi:hypothetical protein